MSQSKKSTGEQGSAASGSREVLASLRAARAEEERKAWSAAFSKKQLAAAAGIAERTVRYYIAEGLLDKPLKRGRAAKYTEYHLGVLKRIAELKEQGFSLEQIRPLVENLNALDPLLNALEFDYQRRGVPVPQPSSSGVGDIKIPILDGLYIGIPEDSHWRDCEGAGEYQERLMRLAGFIRDALLGGGGR